MKKAIFLSFTSDVSGVEHQNRWFEVNASKLGANHFDKKYGSGKSGYTSGSPDYFNKDVFEKGGYTDYINPRDGKNKQSENPIHDPSIVLWDFIF